MIVNHPEGDYHVDVGTRLSQPLVKFQESGVQELIEDKIIRKAKAVTDGRVYQHPVACVPFRRFSLYRLTSIDGYKRARDR